MSLPLKKTFRAALFASTAFALAVGCGDSKSSQTRVEKEAFPASPARDVAPVKTQITPMPDEVPDPVVPEPVEIVEPKAVPQTYAQFMSAAKTLMNEGSHIEAFEYFKSAAEKKPKAAMPRIHMARALLASGDVENARESIELAIEIDPSSSFGWNTMGRVELAEGDVEAAVTSFERSVDENEDNSYAWNNLGFTLMSVERYSEAAAALEQATSGDKPTGYMWNNLGMAYEHQNLIVEARAAYRQGAEMGSSKAQANFARLEGVSSLVLDEVVEDTEDVESDPDAVENVEDVVEVEDLLDDEPNT